MLLTRELFILDRHLHEGLTLMDIGAIIERHIHLLDCAELAEIGSQIVLVGFRWNTRNKQIFLFLLVVAVGVFMY